MDMIQFIGEKVWKGNGGEFYEIEELSGNYGKFLKLIKDFKTEERTN